MCYVHQNSVYTVWSETHLWQSQVETKHYSIAYFDRDTAFEVLQRRTSVKGGANTLCVNVSSIHEFMQRV